MWSNRHLTPEQFFVEKLSYDSETGVLTWKASICTGGKRTHLGLFKTIEQAEAAYLDAKRRLHEGCSI